MGHGMCRAFQEISNIRFREEWGEIFSKLYVKYMQNVHGS